VESEHRCLLVATHPRSGTHFCINSLCLNVTGLRFATIRGQYPSLERLFMPHDERYLDEWETYLDASQEHVRLIKTHLTPADIQRALHADGFLSPRAAAIVRAVSQDAPVLHVHRDGRDAMVSWFHYMKDCGAGLPSDLRPRLQHCSFSEFIRMPNKFYLPMRGFEPHDSSRPRYWQHHVDAWLSHPGAIHTSYEGLHGDFPSALQHIATGLGLADRLTNSPQRPPFVRRSSNSSIAARLYRRMRLMLAVAGHRIGRGVRHYPPAAAWARKGVVGEWKAYFAPSDLDFFMAETGDLLPRLGYKVP
jgi:hypothetical protein